MATSNNSPTSIDPSFFYEVAQFAHTGMAGLIYLSIGHIAQRFHFFSWLWFGMLISCGVGLAALKEFWYDEKYETPVTRGSSLKDFTFYILGIYIAAVVLAL